VGKPDWSERLEAFNTEDGRTVRVKVVKIDQDGDYHVEPVLNDMYSIFEVGGESWSGGPWRIRNVTSAKSSTPSNEELTQRMEMDRAKFNMLRHVLTIASDHPMVGPQAAELLSDLPKPVDPIDPDLIEARRIVADAMDAEGGFEMESIAGTRDGQKDGDWDVRAALTAIKRGRVLEADAFTLAAGGTAHE